MKKQQPQQKENNQIDYKQSRHRLIDQNRQLYFEIFKLENKLSQILTKDIASQFKQKTSTQKNIPSQNQQTQNQILLIKQLKKKIILIKNSSKPQQKQDIRQALDQLTFLKKQRQKFISQKEALIKKIKPKKQALQLNQPLQDQRKSILKSYKQTQRQNNALKSKALKIQRQIMNLHKIKQSTKSPQPKNTQNHQLQMRVTQNQILKVQKEIKQIEKQWQPRLDSLNVEYFALKEIKEERQQEIEAFSKMINTFKNRILAMKQESQILKDKERISQIVISPQKRNQILEIHKNQLQKKQFFKQFQQRPLVGSKSLSTSMIKEKKKQILVKKIQDEKQKITEPSKIFATEIVLKKEQKFQNVQKINQKQAQHFNQFQALKSPSKQIKQKSPLKNSISVAVGTTFYYNQDD